MQTHITRLSGVLALMVLAGCGQQAGTTQGQAAKGRLFGVSFQTMNNPFFVDLNEGIRQVVESHGDRLVTLDAQFNSLKQKNDVSDLILQGAAGVFINPVNWEGIRGSLLQAKQKGVPCIIVDAPAKDADLALCTVASDNVEAGRLAAAALAKARPKAKIVVLHLSPNKACIDRVSGFQEDSKDTPTCRSWTSRRAKARSRADGPSCATCWAASPTSMPRFPSMHSASQWHVRDPVAFHRFFLLITQ